jgi:hypothetical protein
MNPMCFLLIAFSTALTACGGDSGQGRQPPASRLIHSPPIGQLAAQQLRTLSMECEKYTPDGSTRGPYDAAYCEDAIAAWGDSPLQIVTIDKNAAAAAPVKIP